MIKKFLFSYITLILVVTIVNSKVYELGEVLVKSTKIESGVKNLPFPVTIIGQEEIKRNYTLDEVVKKVAGVHSIRSHPSSFGVFVTMRGHALVKQVVSLDGQPINDGFNGYVRWSVLPEEIVESVEVIRGPFSGVYGPYGMGGVINFKPKYQIEENEIKFEKNSLGINSGSFLYGLSFKNKLNTVLYFEQKDIEGYEGDFVVVTPTTTAPAGTAVTVTGWQETTTPKGEIAFIIGSKGRQYSRNHTNFYCGLQYFITPTQELLFSYLYGRQNHGFEGGRTYLRNPAGNPVNSGLIRIDHNGKSYGFSPISLVNFLDMEGVCGQDVLNLKYQNRVSENFSFNIFSGLNTRVQKWSSPIGGATESGGPGRKGTPEGISYRLGLETKFNKNILLPKILQFENLIIENSLLVGLEGTHNEAAAKRERLSNWKDTNSVLFLEEEASGKANILSGYILDEIKLLDGMIGLWLGGRYDNWKIFDGVMKTSYTVTTYPEQEVLRFSPKLGLMLRPLNFVSFKTSYGSGFRMPTVHELYRQLITSREVSLGNPNLKPEINDSVDFMIELYPKVLLSQIRVTYFQDRTKDLIYIKRWRDVHPETGLMVDYLQRQNVGEAETKGYEIELNGKRGNISGIEYNFYTNASIQEPKIIKNPANTNIEGKIVPYVPREMYNFGINISWKPINFDISLHKRGKVFVLDDNSDKVNGVVGSIDPFTTVDCKISYDITKYLNLMFKVHNLLDEKYYSMHNQLAPGRNFGLSVTAKF